ncbi:MAG: chloride channel protein [Bacteroidales bacterium]|nr:chloride channel protein [Clostridium sp.]MCM1204181.1 chloride channel protein [Bacteroidales bacterium]
MAGEKHQHRKSVLIQYYYRRIKQDVLSLLKWLLLAFLTGYVVGGISSLFSFVLTKVTAFREGHLWVFLLLPAAGMVIVFLYEKIGRDDGGTNQVFSTVRAKDEVPFRSAPLIFVSTALTHLVGGSAGREGAAIQLGGSIGNQLGRWLKLDEEDMHVIVMCGMSAAFSALFGTPMAAAIFAMEVVSVGVMYYTALAPCVISALIAANFAAGLGIHPEVFHVSDIPGLTMVNGLKMGGIAVACAGVSVLFCVLLKETGIFFHRELKNKYVRVAAAGIVVILLTILLQTTNYMGAGIGIITDAIEHGKASPPAFFWKMILTVITMRAGFKGGEIVPSFAIGAAFGCTLGRLLGLSPSLCGAAGMVAVFCGVTNCPLTSILIAFELFGFEGVSYYLIAVSVSYAASGYYSLYKDQTIVYSKYKAKYVNHKTHM